MPRRGPLRIGVQGEEPELSASHANARANPRVQAQKTFPASKSYTTCPAHPPTYSPRWSLRAARAKRANQSSADTCDSGKQCPRQKLRGPLLDTARFFSSPALPKTVRPAGARAAKQGLACAPSSMSSAIHAFRLDAKCRFPEPIELELGRAALAPSRAAEARERRDRLATKHGDGAAPHDRSQGAARRSVHVEKRHGLAGKGFSPSRKS